MVYAMEKVELSAMHEEELSQVRTESEATIEAERTARLKAQKEIEDVRKLAEEQAARFADQAARMAEQSEQANSADAAGLLDDYESVLEQLAEEGAKREAAEKVIAETEAKLQAAKNAAADVASAITISVQPANVTGAADPYTDASAFTITASATTGSLLYQWQRQTATGTRWTNVTDAGVFGGSNTATLAITGADKATYDGYKFRVKLTSTAGAEEVISATGTLTFA